LRGFGFVASVVHDALFSQQKAKKCCLTWKRFILMMTAIPASVKRDTAVHISGEAVDLALVIPAQGETHPLCPVSRT